MLKITDMNLSTTDSVVGKNSTVDGIGHSKVNRTKVSIKTAKSKN